MNYIMNLDIYDFIPLLNKAIEKREEEYMWQRWLVELPRMEEFVPFSVYIDKIKPTKISTQSKESILNDVNEIRKKARK